MAIKMEKPLVLGIEPATEAGNKFVSLSKIGNYGGGKRCFSGREICLRGSI